MLFYRKYKSVVRRWCSISKCKCSVICLPVTNKQYLSLHYCFQHKFNINFNNLVPMFGILKIDIIFRWKAWELPMMRKKYGMKTSMSTFSITLAQTQNLQLVWYTKPWCQQQKEMIDLFCFVTTFQHKSQITLKMLYLPLVGWSGIGCQTQQICGNQ